MRIKKFLLFALLFIFCLFIDNTVNASFTFNHNGEEINLPDLPTGVNLSNGYLITYRHVPDDQLPAGVTINNNYYQVAVLSDSSSFFYMNNYSCYVSGKATGLEFINNEWVRYDDLTGFLFNSYSSIFVSSVDIYTDINKSDIYFINTNPKYSNFPYILNSEEDLGKGEEDLIIMPRRFYKHRRNSFWFTSC